MAHGATVHPFIPREERTIDGDGLSNLLVDLTETLALPGADGELITYLADGGIDVDFDPGIAEAKPAEGAEEHYANLAEHLSPAQRMAIAQDVIEMVDADLASRQPWYERIAKGLDVIGIRDERGVAPPFKGASTVVHPLIAEAIVQFQARALAELFPATGPAKAVVMGKRDREKDEQRERVENYLNYQSTVEDKPYFAESDMLLWMIGYEGSVFRKTYNDPLTRKNVRRLVRAEHFVVPYSATTLEDSPRYTHILPYSQNEMKRLQRAAFFLNIPLGTPAARSETAESSVVDAAKAEAEGKTDPDVRDEDRDHTVYETNVYYDVPGFEDLDELGKPTGIALPYVITVERDTADVLAIRRAWKPDDLELRLRRTQFTHYPFIRGDGFYAYGFIHLAGGLGRAATGVLRVVLDNAAFAALQGGFKSKDAKLPSDVTLTPGLWIDTDMSADELEKSFYTPPFKDVPAALFSVLELLTAHGERLMSTTEATVGDAKNTGPVGTTVALIEQGSKIQTGIHKRLHHAIGEELQQLAELNFEHLPDEGYPYDVEGDSREIFGTDFDERVDVQPVSDPNIFSQTQRIAIAQTELQLAQSAPQLYDMRAAHRRMLKAIRSPDIDELMPPEAKVERYDPVTENALAIVGKPIKVYPDQHHGAHNAVHMGELQTAIMQKAPHAERLQQVLLPHMAEHAAMGMRISMMQQLGVPLPPMDLHAEPGKPVVLQPLPPEVENMVAVKSAEIMQQMLAKLQQAQAQQEQAATQAATQSEEAQKEASFKADEARKDRATQSEEHRKDVRTKTEIERKDAQSGIDPALIKQAEEYLAQKPDIAGIIQPRRLAVIARELDKSFDDVVKILMTFAAAGQGVGPSPVAAGMTK